MIQEYDLTNDILIEKSIILDIFLFRNKWKFFLSEKCERANIHNRFFLVILHFHLCNLSIYMNKIDQNFRLAYLYVCNNINKKNCNPFPAFDLNYPTRILLLIKLPKTFNIFSSVWQWLYRNFSLYSFYFSEEWYLRWN